MSIHIKAMYNSHMSGVVIAWALFFLLGISSFVVLSWMFQLTGGAGKSAIDSALKLFTPYAFGALIVGNLLQAAGLYYGFQSSSFAIPLLSSMGVITGFVFSAVVLGAPITLIKIGGVALIVAGIFLLK